MSKLPMYYGYRIPNNSNTPSPSTKRKKHEPLGPCFIIFIHCLGIISIHIFMSHHFQPMLMEGKGDMRVYEEGVC